MIHHDLHVYDTFPHSLKKKKGCIMNVISTTDGDMLQGVWDGEDCQINMCRVTQGEHFEHLWDYRHNYTSLQISFKYMLTQHSYWVWQVEFSKDGHIIPHALLLCELAIPPSSGGVCYSTPLAWKDPMAALINILWWKGPIASSSCSPQSAWHLLHPAFWKPATM